jgi:hypothetical protein
MQVIPIKTRVLTPPQDDLFAVLDEYLTDVQEGDIIAISSKVVALHEGRCESLTKFPVAPEASSASMEAKRSNTRSSLESGIMLLTSLWGPVYRGRAMHCIAPERLRMSRYCAVSSFGARAASISAAFCSQSSTT